MSRPQARSATVAWKTRGLPTSAINHQHFPPRCYPEVTWRLPFITHILLHLLHDSMTTTISWQACKRLEHVLRTCPCTSPTRPTLLSPARLDNRPSPRPSPTPSHRLRRVANRNRCLNGSPALWGVLQSAADGWETHSACPAWTTHSPLRHGQARGAQPNSPQVHSMRFAQVDIHSLRFDLDFGRVVFGCCPCKRAPTPWPLSAGGLRNARIPLNWDMLTAAAPLRPSQATADDISNLLPWRHQHQACGRPRSRPFAGWPLIQSVRVPTRGAEWRPRRWSS